MLAEEPIWVPFQLPTNGLFIDRNHIYGLLFRVVMLSEILLYDYYYCYALLSADNISVVVFLTRKGGPVKYHVILGLFVCLVALRPKSADMVMAGRSVHLTTLFPGQA